MTISVDLFVSILASLAAGVGAYAAIRYDLGKLHERSTMAMESAAKAHARIDQLHQRN